MTAVDPENESTYAVRVVPSTFADTAGVKEDILNEVDGCGFCADTKFSIKLALEEALTNAIKHGNCGDASRHITLRYAVTPERVVVIVRDEGCGFHPDDVPDPTTPERLPIPSGRGIMLIRAYMDEVTYRDNGREIRFVKRRTR
jgi:serine/threonine-protein kinase RsbW